MTLCVVTDRKRLGHFTSIAAAIDALVAQAARAAEAGLDLFQIREPDLPDTALLDLAQRAREAAQGSALRVLINDRLDIALAASLDGVHLRGTSYAAPRARAVIGSPLLLGAPSAAAAPQRAALEGAAETAGQPFLMHSIDRAATAPFLIGRSVHSAEEAAAVAAAGGLDYLILGAMFPTASKPPDHPLAGIESLRAAVRACRLPILAIGGITLDNAAHVASAGAAGLAAIGLFATGDLRAIAARLRQIFADAPRRA
jgi:thiamine-phosphate pyrophosphorylase